MRCNMPIFPIWFNDGSTPKPDKKTFFEIASNGAFLHKENQFWKAIVPVERIGILAERKPSFEALLPSISSEITVSITRFFAWIAYRMNAESMVFLWWDSEKNAYSISIPPQRVDYRGIEYDNPPNPGYKLIGTIHSHGAIPAGHSGIDHKDEKFFDGIHATFGNFSRGINNFQISLQASVNNSRFFLNPLDLFEGIKAFNRYSDLGLENKDSSEKSPAVLEAQDRDSWFFRGNRNPYPNSYSLTETELMPVDYRPSPEWMAMVKGMSFRSTFSLYEKYER